MFKTCILVSSIIILFQLSENYKTYPLPCDTLRAETTFSRYELACEKQPLPTTVQFSIVYAQNSSHDSQATGSSNLREFCENQTCENYLRTTLLELLFCFSASPPLVLSILAAKFPWIVFFRKVFLCYQLQEVLSAWWGAHLTSNGSFFPAYYLQ